MNKLGVAVNLRSSREGAPRDNSRADFREVRCFLLPCTWMPSLILRKYHFSYRAVDKFAAGSRTGPAPELNQSSGSASAVKAGPRKSGWIVLFVVLTALSPAFLGGDVSKYGEVVPVIGTGLLLFVFPLRAAPANSVLIGMAGLLLCGLAGFLPARWIGEPEWHSAIRQAIPGLGNTVTLQPLHSLIRFGVMLSAILFAVWVYPMAAELRSLVFSGFVRRNRSGGNNRACGAFLLLFGARLAPKPRVRSISKSESDCHFDRPRRNIGFGSLCEFFRRRDWSGIVWVLAFTLCLAALLLTNSRAPLCLLLSGSFLWFFKLQRSPLKGFSVAGGVTLLVCAATLLIGESVARRLPELLFHGPGFRAKIYQDTFRLAWASPAVGTGVGNFEAIFPRFRDASAERRTGDSPGERLAVDGQRNGVALDPVLRGRHRRPFDS